MPDLQDLSLDLSQSIKINTSIGDVFDAVIRRLSTEKSTPDNKPMPMVLESWPGGRWYRDLGDSQGHLWGFVQVIKPPTLIEIQGPMFMSYAVAGHLQLRLIEMGDDVELSLRHRVLGFVEDSHREGVNHGWDWFLQSVKKAVE